MPIVGYSISYQLKSSEIIYYTLEVGTLQKIVILIGSKYKWYIFQTERVNIVLTPQTEN